MNIEIFGAGFVNKGAELMLRSAVEEVRSWDSGIRCVAAPTVGTYEDRAGAGLWHRVDLARLGPLRGVVGRLIPSRYLRQFGMVLAEDVEAVLDASGFRYSDQWGSGTSETLRLRVRAAKRRGSPYVLLPQAFGPFEDPGTRRAFRDAVANVDLIFARDEDSLEHVREITGDDPRVFLSPDFTAVLKPLPPTRQWVDGSDPLAAVVPNYRMLDKTDAVTRERYIDFLRTSLRELTRSGMQAVLVVHSGGSDDPKLARLLAEESDSPICVVQETDARRLKGFIGTCEVVVGSRFHALVNGLAQEVPCVGTGWSHKYQRLFESYDCADYLVDLRKPAEEGVETLRRIGDPAERKRLRARIAEQNLRVADEIRAMWSRVRGVVLGRSEGRAA